MLTYAGEYLASRTRGSPPCRRALVIGSAALVSELQERGIHCVAPDEDAGGYSLYLLYWYKSTNTDTTGASSGSAASEIRSEAD